MNQGRRATVEGANLDRTIILSELCQLAKDAYANRHICAGIFVQSRAVEVVPELFKEIK
jgi:dihydroorotase